MTETKLRRRPKILENTAIAMAVVNTAMCMNTPRGKIADDVHSVASLSKTQLTTVTKTYRPSNFSASLCVGAVR